MWSAMRPRTVVSSSAIDSASPSGSSVIDGRSIEGSSVLDRRTHRDQQADAIGVKTTGHETQRVCALVVQPLRVIDDDQQRATGRRRGGEEREHCEADEEWVRRAVIADAERGVQGPGLRRRQGLEPVEERGEQLVQCGEPESHLRLDAHEAHDVEVRDRRRHGVHQARLPDPGLAAHHHDTAQPAGARSRSDGRSRFARPHGRPARSRHDQPHPRRDSRSFVIEEQSVALADYAAGGFEGLGG